MIDTHDPTLALDRLLALRPEDLDGWERDVAETADDREAEVALDALFADALSGWASADLGEPRVTAERVLAAEGPPAPRRSTRPWLAPAAIAASVALVGLATWQMRPADRGLKGLVTATEATRIHLDFAIEHTVDGRVRVEPGREDVSLDSADAIAMRLGIEGAGGWVTLHEVGAEGSTLIYPLDGRPRRIGAGTERLQGPDGEDLVYRPEEPGRFHYVALVTDEPVDTTTIVQDVLEAGETRPDLWPRHVLSIDGFTATWSD